MLTHSTLSSSSSSSSLVSFENQVEASHPPCSVYTHLMTLHSYVVAISGFVIYKYWQSCKWRRIPEVFFQLSPLSDFHSWLLFKYNKKVSINGSLKESEREVMRVEAIMMLLQSMPSRESTWYEMGRRRRDKSKHMENENDMF